MCELARLRTMFRTCWKGGFDEIAGLENACASICGFHISNLRLAERSRRLRVLQHRVFNASCCPQSASDCTFQGGRVVRPGVVASQEDAWLGGLEVRAKQAGAGREGGAFFPDYLVPASRFGHCQFGLKGGGQRRIIELFPVAMAAEYAGEQAMTAINDPLAMLAESVA